MPVEAVSSAVDPTQFLEQAIARFSVLIAHCSGNGVECENRLRSNGHVVLQEHAGSGYRRPLMKRLSAVSLEMIEKGC
jgi:hypothetical protein